MIEIGAQRLVGEVFFPQPRREELDLQRRMRIDALQHIDQIAIGIDAVQATRGEHTVDDADLSRADFRPTEEPMSDRQSLRKGKVYEPVGDGNFL